jgi:hypothetical protein
MTAPMIALAIAAATVGALLPTWLLLRIVTDRATDGRHN